MELDQLPLADNHAGQGFQSHGRTMKHDAAQAARTLLTYLARLPERFAVFGHSANQQTRRFLAETALDASNCLLWLQPTLEPNSPHKEQPIGQSAESLWSLGSQFRQVGLALWDAPAAPASEVELLRQEVVKLSQALERLQPAPNIVPLAQAK